MKEETTAHILERQRKFPIRRPVIQLASRLSVKDGRVQDAATTAIASVLDWIEHKQGIRLPPGARNLESFEVDAADGHPIEAICFDDLWSIQYDKLAPEVPGRIWRTEATVAHDGNVAIAGIRLAVIDSAQLADFATSIPAVIAEWIRRPGLLDGCGQFLDNRPTIIDSDHTLNQLEALLKNRDRSHPVLLFSATHQNDAYRCAEKAAIRLAGLAHVAVINESCSRALTDHLGREFSVWNGAVRTYQTHFNPAVDESHTHPLATPEWLARRFGGIDNFLNTVRHILATQTVRSSNSEDFLPSFRSIKQAGMEKRIRHLPAGSGERLLLVEDQNKLLYQKVKELTSQYEYAAEEVAQAEQERDQYRGMVMALRAQNDAMRAELTTDIVTKNFPSSFDTIDEWVEANLAGRLLLLTRATRAARKSPFNEPGFIYRCMERLATDYLNARRLGTVTEGIFEDLGVQLERTGDEAHLRQWKEHYFVLHKGKSRFFEWHLKRGSDKNETHTMRIYFFYDEDDEQVVVGYLPGHLPNSRT